MDRKHLDRRAVVRDLDEVERHLADAVEGRFRIERLQFHLAGVPTYIVLAELAGNNTEAALGLGEAISLRAGGQISGLEAIKQMIDPKPRVAHLRAEVMAVAVGQFLPGDESEPEEKGQILLAGPLREALVDLEEGLLEHVGGIDPAGQAAVQAQPHHPLQPLGNHEAAFRRLGQRTGHDQISNPAAGPGHRKSLPAVRGLGQRAGMGCA